VALGANKDRLTKCITDGELYGIPWEDKLYAETDSNVWAPPTFIFRNNKTGKTRFAEGLNTTDYLQRVLDEVKRP
jgi:hypothetical protein